jgi:hypothetical protein
VRRPIRTAQARPRTPASFLDPRDYYYRRVFADAVRAVVAVRSHESVDPARVAVTGISQGGGITIAVAGLMPDIVAAAPDVPFLCDFPRAITLAEQDPYEEIARYLKVHRNHVEAAHRTLSYFDGAVLARRAVAPALFSVGMMDHICPPSTVYAAYNQYGGPREMREYTFSPGSRSASGPEEGAREDRLCEARLVLTPPAAVEHARRPSTQRGDPAVRTRPSVVFTIACLAVLAGSGPATAAFADVDHLVLGTVAKGKVSYGTPATPATIDWELWKAGPPKVWRARTYGNIGATGPNPTTLCARLKVQFLDKVGTVLATRVSNSTQMVCLPPNTGGNGRGIAPPIYLDSAKVRKVRVMLQRSGGASGP